VRAISGSLRTLTLLVAVVSLLVALNRLLYYYALIADDYVRALLER